MRFTVVCDYCPPVLGWPVTWIFQTHEARDRWADWHMERGHPIRTAERDD